MNLRLIAAASLFALISLTACVRPATPEGWSGGVVAEDRLYIGTMEGDLRALDINTGETIWRFELRGEDREHAIYGRPAIVGDTLYVGDYDGTLYALRTLDREEIWDTRVGDAQHIVGGPTIVDDMVLVGSSDGNMYAFDATDGSQRWSFPSGNSVWSTPTVVDGVAYFGSLDHNVYAVRLEDGSKAWSFPTGGAITAVPVVASGRVYVGSFDSVFYAIDARSGRKVWSFDGASKWYWGGAVATEDTIFAPSLDGVLYALDIDSGEVRWTLKTDAPLIGSPAVVSNRIAVPSMDGRVRVVRLQDGEDERQCNIGVKIRASLTAGEGKFIHEEVEYEGVIYLSASDHSIRALGVKQNGNPDEIWVHFTNEENPVPGDWVRSC